MPWILPHAAHAKRRVVLTLGVLFLLLSGCLQIEIRDRVRYRWSTAENGLVLREGPGLEYARIGTIPFGARVRFVGIASGTTILAGHVGRWNKVVYQNMVGFSYDAFLAEAPPGRLRLSVGHSPIPTDVASVSPDSNHRGKAIEPPREPSGLIGPEKTIVRDDPPEAIVPPAADFAYAAHDIPGLIRLSSNEFNKIVQSLEADFHDREVAFHDSAGARGRDESVEDYLKRSEETKRRFLEQLRREEHAAATRVYSIHDARLELGPYEPGLGRFAWLGTTILIDTSSEIITLPDVQAAPHRFVNGRKYNVVMTPAQAKAIRDARKEIRVRIDFSYTESLQDLFKWTRKAYFLPRYLMLYHRQTGRIYYACRILPRVELDSDPAAPLSITSRLLGESVY